MADELDLERERLRFARSCLAAMRHRAEQLGAVGGDAYSTEALEWHLRQRVLSLADNPSTPLYFGRLDFAAATVLAEGNDGDRTRVRGEAGERHYVGRRHVLDELGDPVVMDWRAPLARAFYRARPGEPMGLERRRRFGFSGGDLTAYEDERFGEERARDASPMLSPLVVEEIERPRAGPMRDIAATIQPDQDELVRAPVDVSICVQGAPGTGKTAVGLHRAAYLLYAHRERLRRAKVLIVGPNRAFLAYIAQVLPALGEVDVEQLSLEELASASVPVRADDPPAAAAVKADARMAAILRRALWARGAARPDAPVNLVLGGRHLHVGQATVAELAGGARDLGARYVPTREALRLRIVDRLARQAEEGGDLLTDGDLRRLGRHAAVRTAVDTVLPPVSARGVVFDLLADRDVAARAADGMLDAGELEALCWDQRPRGLGSARWSVADGFLVDEVADLLERTPSYGHVVIDEAQDLSPMQARALARRSATGSVTVLGDLAQGTTPWASADWARVLGQLGKPDAELVALTQGFRVPADILHFANRLLPALGVEVAPATSVRAALGTLDVRPVASEALLTEVVESCRRALAGDGSVGLLVDDGALGRAARALRRAPLSFGTANEPGPARLTLVPVSLAKGLEFDHVVVVEPAEIAAAPPNGLRRLYVALTRAVTALTVVHAQPLPAPLG